MEGPRRNYPANPLKMRYAEGGTRTRTGLTPLDFESSVSANFTTSAKDGIEEYCEKPRVICQGGKGVGPGQSQDYPLRTLSR